MNNQELLKYWQNRLGLDDWYIKLHDDCTQSDIDSVGEVSYEEVKKLAVIKILKSECYSEEFVIPFNFEKTLVHELLHVKLCLLDKSGNDLQDRIVHQLVEELAKAFVKDKTKEAETDWKELYNEQLGMN